MDKSYNTQNRKTDHIRINLEEDVTSSIQNGFEQFGFIHDALPEMNLVDVSTATDFLGHHLDLPLLISSMTGGTPESSSINERLAEAAQETGIAMGLGSMRAAIEEPKAAASFQLRKIAPDVLLFANLGAIQLNYGYGFTECLQVIEIAGADGIILHLNPLQEALQPEGQTNFSGLLLKIEALCSKLSVPVIVKEVGWGISEETAVRLKNAGVAVIDIAGAGGTSWSQVEMYRSQTESDMRISSHFRDWGITTAESLKLVKKAVPDMPVIASGGIVHGVDLAKAIAMGASLGGIAGRFLKAAVISSEEVVMLVSEIQKELKIAMFACGAKDIDELGKTPLIRRKME